MGSVAFELAVLNPKIITDRNFLKKIKGLRFAANFYAKPNRKCVGIFMATHLVKIWSRLGWVSVPGLARTLFLCGTYAVFVRGSRTVSLWHMRSLSVAGTVTQSARCGWVAGGSRATPTALGLASSPTPHTAKIAIPQLRGMT